MNDCKNQHPNWENNYSQTSSQSPKYKSVLYISQGEFIPLRAEYVLLFILCIFSHLMSSNTKYGDKIMPRISIICFLVISQSSSRYIFSYWGWTMDNIGSFPLLSNTAEPRVWLLDEWVQVGFEWGFRRGITKIVPKASPCRITPFPLKEYLWGSRVSRRRGGEVIFWREGSNLSVVKCQLHPLHRSLSPLAGTSEPCTGS